DIHVLLHIAPPSPSFAWRTLCEIHSSYSSPPPRSLSASSIRPQGACPHPRALLSMRRRSFSNSAEPRCASAPRPSSHTRTTRGRDRPLYSPRDGSRDNL